MRGHRSDPRRNPGSPVVSGIVTVLALAGGFLAGCLGALAVASGLAAIGTLLHWANLEQRCSRCKELPSPYLQTEADHEEIKGRRTMHLFAGIGLAFLALIFSVLWVLLVLLIAPKPQ